MTWGFFIGRTSGIVQDFTNGDSMELQINSYKAALKHIIPHKWPCWSYLWDHCLGKYVWKTIQMLQRQVEHDIESLLTVSKHGAELCKHADIPKTYISHVKIMWEWSCNFLQDLSFLGIYHESSMTIDITLGFQLLMKVRRRIVNGYQPSADL